MNTIQLRDGDVLVLKVPAEGFYACLASGDVAALEILRTQIQRDVIEPMGRKGVAVVVLPDDSELQILTVRPPTAGR